ncbi:MAG TPA: hypothetical protein V6C97_36610 [Oculatellaceae cyanobacterium]
MAKHNHLEAGHEKHSQAAHLTHLTNEVHTEWRNSTHQPRSESWSQKAADLEHLLITPINLPGKLGEMQKQCDKMQRDVDSWCSKEGGSISETMDKLNPLMQGARKLADVINGR